MNAETDVRAASNLRIWDELSKTDPRHTKPFKRAGGFSGTALKPIWIVKRLTEQFGPCGEGWGIEQPDFQVVPGFNNEVLVYCTVRCWHGSPDRAFYGVGGDKVITHIKANDKFNRPERWESDDEAFKKAFTDAVNNAFKFVGVGADIHMGQFEDNKYVQDTTQEFETAENDAERQKVPGISAIKKRLNAMMIAGNAATEAEIFSALVKSNKDDLKTIRDAGHAYWTGDGEDWEGFNAWIARRRAELTPPETSLQFQLLMSTLAECETVQQLSDWTAKNLAVIDELDGAESRAYEEAYNTRETAIHAMDSVSV